jgi:hypothetical protein
MNDGGPAFPYKFDWPNGASEHNYGLTMRDWFAGLAMQGICAAHAHPQVMWTPGYTQESANGIASSAYLLADAMLKEREK